MKPFLLLPRYVHNSDDKWIKVRGRVRPDEIADYYQGANNGTVVVLKSGSSFLLDIEIEELDYILSEYYKKVETAPDEFGFLQIITPA